MSSKYQRPEFKFRSKKKRKKGLKSLKIRIKLMQEERRTTLKEKKIKEFYFRISKL